MKNIAGDRGLLPSEIGLTDQLRNKRVYWVS